MVKEALPDFMKQGEVARLFPVLSTTSKEGRTTSIVLACMSKIHEFGAHLLMSVGQKVGVRTTLETYTEVVFQKLGANGSARPDGLIILKTGRKEWRALVEAKVGNTDLTVDQIEHYRKLAQDNDIDCVITISNQFATTPQNHPLSDVQKSRSNVAVFHWSWMHILTIADLLLSDNGVEDVTQRHLLNELRRFLSHDSAGVRGFDRMPAEWSALNKLVSSGGMVSAKSPLVQPVLEAWHQETRDLSLILSRLTGAQVIEKLPRKYLSDPTLRMKEELQVLKERQCLVSVLHVPDAVAPIDILADISRRSIDVGMTLRAPEDRKSTKARVNWLLRQIKTERVGDLFVRLMWPGKSDPTQHALSDLRSDPTIAEEGKEHLSPHGFHIFLSRRVGARFTQQINFISELEDIVPRFYGEFGSILQAWQKKAPQLKPDRISHDDVSVAGLSEDSEDFEAE